MNEDEEFDFATPPDLALAPGLHPALAQAMAEEAAAEATPNYRDPANPGHRYGLVLRQVDDFVRILKRLEAAPASCWYVHPQLVSLIESLRDRWSSPKTSGVGFWTDLFHLTSQCDLWSRAKTHKSDQHPTDDDTRTASLMTFEEVASAADRGETAMWAEDRDDWEANDVERSSPAEASRVDIDDEERADG